MLSLRDDLQVKATMRTIREVRANTLPPSASIPLAYEVMLRRDPDPGGWQDRLGRFKSGTLTWSGMLDEIRGSEEYQQAVRFGPDGFGSSIHLGRQQFIRALPKAARIVDLGGTHLGSDEGALVKLGYPYDFEELTIIDLPSDDRHQRYQSERRPDQVQTERGPVSYRYHSMTELSDFADESIDLVYSGQSIEHVPPDGGAHVAKEVFRLLRPGGHFAIDTPNGRVTRLQQAAFIDPDHKVEYTYGELRQLLEQTGFTIVFAKGLNYAGPAAAAGHFDRRVVAGNAGLYDDIEDCYILCLIAKKPAASN